MVLKEISLKQISQVGLISKHAKIIKKKPTQASYIKIKKNKAIVVFYQIFPKNQNLNLEFCNHQQKPIHLAIITRLRGL